MVRALITATLLLVGFVANAQTVTLTAVPTSGVGSVDVTLTWTSTGVTSCVASSTEGNWSGPKDVNGSQLLPGIKSTRTYTLTCTGNTGTAQLTWVPPTTNTNGTALTNLASYRVCHGQTQAGLGNCIPVSAPANAFMVTGLPAGLRYFAVKAVSSTGVESIFSNVVSKNVVTASVSSSATVVVDTRPKAPVIESIE